MWIWLLTVGSTVQKLKIKCAMKSYKLSELKSAEIDGLKARPRIDFTSIFNVVSFNKFFVKKVNIHNWSNLL